MSSAGWIKLWRKLLDNPWLADPIQLAVFVRVLLDAEHEPHERRYAHGVVTVGRGQSLVSVVDLAKTLGVGRQSIRRAIANLEKAGIFNHQTNHRYTLLTICNFDKYQCPQPQSQPLDQPQANHKPTTLLESKKERKKESDGPSVHLSRGSRLPPDWLPSGEQRAYAERLGLDPERTALDFRDYWCAVPGQRGLKIDWNRTWQTRCRELADRQARDRARVNGNGRHGQREQPTKRENWYGRRLIERYGFPESDAGSCPDPHGDTDYPPFGRG